MRGYLENNNVNRAGPNSLFALTVAALLLTGCSGIRGGDGNVAQGTNLKTGPISEITFERILGCEGRCPLYKVVLRKDGTASYVGTDHAERKGRYHASNIDYYFIQLSKLIENNRYLSLQDSYGPEGKDEGIVITSVAINDTRKTIEDHGSRGPIELWAIEMSIEGSLSEIQWEKDR